MGRKKKDLPPGRKSHFTGEKQEWLETIRDAIRDAGEDVGSVYIEAANSFLLRYGYDFPFGENVDGNPEDNSPDTSPVTDLEEKTRWDGIRNKLRSILSNYFRNRWRVKKVHAATLKGILGTMQTISGSHLRPQRQPAIGLYSKLHYMTRVKPKFEAIWSDAKKTLPEGERVNMSQKFTWSCWAKEDTNFKREIKEQALENHQIALEKWKAARKIPEGSAEEYYGPVAAIVDAVLGT
ncbi:hypothetical protein K438DRAFT_1958967 [Mycena galopus ATCC 62051]|nr:hypothetical protein K438DRAFT_1958967 [Mycena galopus ATCC 62051]